jgi:hypothetical protein
VATAVGLVDGVLSSSENRFVPVSQLRTSSTRKPPSKKDATDQRQENWILVRTVKEAAFLAVVLTSIAVVSSRANGPRDLFSSYDIVSFRLDAPFDDLFAGAKDNPEYAVDGTLRDTTGGRTTDPVPVTVSLRGHTSRRDTECTFPKLKIGAKNGREPLAGGGKSIKLGTHCGESRDDSLTARFGRLPNEKSPLREAAVYRLLDALQIPALRARPARVMYAFTGEETRTIERNAMLLEDEGDAVSRIRGTREIAAARFTTAADMFAPDDSANLAFAQALIGNFDWCIKFTTEDAYRCDARLKLWNVIAAAMKDGNAKPLMHDFDVTGMVAGRHRWLPDVYNAAFVPSKSEREVEVIAQLQRTRSLFDRKLLDTTRRRFLHRKTDAYRAIDAADVDPDGRRQIREYADAFYREIESDENFYRPVVTKPGTMLRQDGSPNAAPACTSLGAIPVGTPVSAPIDSRNGMVKVVVLDALWHWSPAKCPIVHRGMPWVEQQAIGRDFPRQ